MHANGLAHVGGASAVQTERNSGLIKMSIETRRSLECSNIELVRIFERYFGFVWDGLGHGTGHLCENEGRLIAHPQRAIMIWINCNLSDGAAAARRSDRAEPAAR